MAQQRNKLCFPTEAARLLRLWAALLLLGGIEFGVAFLPLGHVARPLVLIPAISMIGVVAVGFMNIARGPVIGSAFAVAGIFWLLVLLGLGSVDPLTRTDHAVYSRAAP